MDWDPGSGDASVERTAAALALAQELRRILQLLRGEPDVYADLEVDYGRPFPEERE